MLKYHTFSIKIRPSQVTSIIKTKEPNKPIAAIQKKEIPRHFRTPRPRNHSPFSNVDLYVDLLLLIGTRLIKISNEFIGQFGEPSCSMANARRFQIQKALKKKKIIKIQKFSILMQPFRRLFVVVVVVCPYLKKQIGYSNLKLQLIFLSNTTY